MWMKSPHFNQTLKNIVSIYFSGFQIRCDFLDSILKLSKLRKFQWKIMKMHAFPHTTNMLTHPNILHMRMRTQIGNFQNLVSVAHPSMQLSHRIGALPFDNSLKCLWNSRIKCESFKFISISIRNKKTCVFQNRICNVTKIPPCNPHAIMMSNRKPRYFLAGTTDPKMLIILVTSDPPPPPLVALKDA